MPGSAGTPEDPPEGSEDGLFTAEDLFGDLVDAPPAPRPPTLGGPVKVQIAEKNRPDAAPPTAEVAPEEMAGLIDAFDEPPPQVVRPVIHQPPPQPAPVTPQAAPPQAKAASPIASGGAEVDALLDTLSAMEEPVAAVVEAPPEPAPVIEPTPPPAPPGPTAEAEEEDLNVLLDGLSEDVPMAASPEPTPLSIAPEPPPAEEPPVTVEPEPEAPLEAESVLPPPPPAPPLATAGPDLDQMFSNFLNTSEDAAPAGSRPEPEPAPPPASFLEMKFNAASPAVEAAAETRSVIDLAALADEALSLPLTRPGVKAAPTEGETPLEGVPPDAFGPYRLVERIASGGMAEVFKAKRTGVEGFEKVLAVKRILPHLSDNKEFVEMFIDEAKMVAGLTHPNIVQIFDLGRIEKTYFIAMEYVQGKDLRTILKKTKEKGVRIPLDLSVLIVSRVCSALEYAHRKKDDEGQPLRIVHRDISPQNILISFEGEVKLTDFGIAKATSKATTTDRGALRGKLLYMSPEQASGVPMDRRSDVFSLGVVFYEMITDAKPFLGSTEKGILEMVRECRIEPPRSLNPRVTEKLEQVMMKALEKNPDQRYQDASEMYKDLERVLHARQPPAASELARFMDALFDASLPASAMPAEPADEGIEIDVDMDEPQASTPTEPEARKDSLGIGGRLLKRFGIK